MINLGDVETTLKLGDTEVQKVYLGTTEVWTPPATGVLLGYARYNLPSPWTVDESGTIWTRPSFGEQVMPYQILGEGGMATKYTEDNDGAFYFISDESASDYKGMVLHGVGLTWIDAGGSGSTSPQPNVGDFVVIRRVGSDIFISITSDFGVTYTDVKTWTGVGYTHTLCEVYGSLKIVDPQQKGFST